MAINSRSKGKRGELEWARKCRDEGYGSARRTAQYCGSTGDASDVVGLPGIHQEVKRTESLQVWGAMSQAIRDASAASKGELPIVAFRRNDYPWLVFMLADDWFKLYHAYDLEEGLSEKSKEENHGNCK